MLLQILQVDDVMLEVLLPPQFRFGQISGPLCPSLLISWDCRHVRVPRVLGPCAFCFFYAFTNPILALAAVDSMRSVRLILAVYSCRKASNRQKSKCAAFGLPLSSSTPMPHVSELPRPLLTLDHPTMNDGYRRLQFPHSNSQP